MGNFKLVFISLQLYGTNDLAAFFGDKTYFAISQKILENIIGEINDNNEYIFVDF